jgi:fructokinase
MGGRITCMGEILIDFLPIEEEGRTVGFRMHPGGSPFNVAMGVARLGQPTSFAGMVSSDLFGRYLRSFVEQQGIDTRFLLTSDASSTLAFVGYEDGEPAYAFYREGAADTRLTPEALPDAMFEETRALHVGSISLLKGSTPAAVIAAAERLKGHALIQFDPNVRAGLVEDEAGYRATIKRLFELADVVKISSVDLSWLMPDMTSLERAIGTILRHGPALVVVTQGSKGILAGRQGDTEILHVPPFAVRVVDTVGAGDTFDAGILAGLAEHGALDRPALASLRPNQVRATLRFAAAAAALNVTRAGANPPRREEVEQFLAEHGEH